MLTELQTDPVPLVKRPSFENWETQPPLAMLASRHAETLAWGKKWLERFGFKVAVATSLDEAAAHIRNGVTEIVVVDGSLKHPDGLGACAALRGLPGAAELP